MDPKPLKTVTRHQPNCVKPSSSQLNKLFSYVFFNLLVHKTICFDFNSDRGDRKSKAGALFTYAVHMGGL